MLEMEYPPSMMTDTDDNIYISDGAAIRKISPQAEVTTFAGNISTPGYRDDNKTNALFGGAVGLAIDAVGNVFVADTVNNRIRKIDTSGVVTTLAGSGNPGHQ